jgi:hypothetical protein
MMTIVEVRPVGGAPTGARSSMMVDIAVLPEQTNVDAHQTRVQHHIGLEISKTPINRAQSPKAVL